MKSTPQVRFSQRYQTALRDHLRLRTRGHPNRLSAQTLGRKAVALRLDALALTRIHDRVLASLDFPQRRPGIAMHKGQLTHAGRFFIEVMAPIAKRHASEHKVLERARRLEALLDERTAELAVVRRQVRRETARRKVGEARLAQGAKHYSKLLAQILAGINVQLAGLKESAALNIRSLRRRIAQAQRLVEKSVEVVHRYARELRPALLDDLGLIPALRSYIQSMPGRNGLDVRLSAFAAVEEVDNVRRTVLYRVAQEALTNVARHAHAHVATVRIRRQGINVRLTVHDDGRSFEADRMLASRSNTRLGLLGMRERVEMVGGTFTIQSTPATGTTVRAEIPMRTSNGHKTP